MNKYFNEQSTILLTGASSGIGKCLAEILVTKYNSTVLGVGRSEEKLNMVKTLLGDKFIPITADISLESEWERLYNLVTDNGYKLSGIINCAGVLPKFSSFNSEYYSENKKVIETNFLSVVNSANYFLKVLQNNHPSIMINVSSSSALCPFAGVSLYSSSKVAVERFSECLSAENKKVKIVTVMPGFTKTEVLRSQSLADKERGLIDKISANPNRVAKKILKRASRGKTRIITGIDAYFMNASFKLFPRLTPRLIGWFLRKTKMQIFEKI